MNEQELRIGNWVEWEDESKEQIRISSISYSGTPVNTYFIGYDNNKKEAALWEFCPIPLTEEWLERLGFRKVPVYKGNLSHLQWNKDYNGFFVGLQIHEGGLYYGRMEIKYVHQLQNLYFALTGEELEIKEKTK
jgi:hypothetical protein